MIQRTHCNFCNKDSLQEKYDFKDYTILQCKNCKFLFRDKILSHKEEEDLYDKDYYLNLQREYFINCLTPNPKDKSRLNDFNKRMDLLEKLNNFKKGAKLLDIGAGTGAFCYLVKARGWQTLSVEISPYAVKIAREKFKAPVYRGEVTDKKFKYSGFDVVTLWESIANIEDTPLLLKTVNKIIKKSGKLAILTTVVDSWLYDIARLINWLSFGTITYFLKEGYPIHHANHFTRYHLAKVLKQHGFKIIYRSNTEIPYKYTKLPKIYLPILVIFGQMAKIFGRTIQVLIIAEKT